MKIPLPLAGKQMECGDQGIAGEWAGGKNGGEAWGEVSDSKGQFMNADLAYTERVFSFIDILGFSAAIRQAGRSHESIHALKKVLDYAMKVEGVNNAEICGRKLLATEIIAFSDCIVISAPKSEIFSVVLISKFVAQNLLAMGFACRGGIAIGDGHHEGRCVFGKGFLDAYDLEMYVAIYPRIVFSESAISLWGERNKKTKKADLLRLKKDADGCWFIDIFSSPFPGSVGFDEARYFEAARKLIANGVIHKNLRIASKYRWLENQYEEHKGLGSSTVA